MQVRVRLIKDKDWPGIDRIQHEVFADHLLEDLAVIQCKQRLAPQSCWVIVNRQDEVLGYLLALHWHSLKTPPPLNKHLDKAQGPVLFIHDLSVSPAFHGLGLSNLLWQALVQYVRENAVCNGLLVSVNDSVQFWQQHGFALASNVGANLGYNNDAKLMVQNFSE